MKNFFLLTGILAVGACAANAEQAQLAPSPELPEKPTTEIQFGAVDKDAAPPEKKQGTFNAAMNDASERQKVFDEELETVSLTGQLSQGSLVFGKAPIGSKVRLNGDEVMVSAAGDFVIGFGRDSDASALLVVTTPSGQVERKALVIADRDFPTQRIDGLDQSKVSGFTKEQLDKIAIDSKKKKSARATTHAKTDWIGGFMQPVAGRISGVFGSQRILNGVPKRPHSGLDIAAPTGTPILAPASGIVRLAEEGMYFEGGLVLLDHGHWVESAFLHMSRLDVVEGEYVEKGQVIGAVGSTGRSTGPHLHWSIKWMGRLVDPQIVLADHQSDATNTP